MYQRFTVDKFLLHAKQNELVLTFTLDVDEDTINNSSIYITESKAGMQPILLSSEDAEYSVDGRMVTIHYSELSVNSAYEIHATKKVESIMGDALEVEFVKEFVIPSSVDSIITILSPADYEAVDDLVLRLEEKEGPSKKLFQKFQIQVASDVNFLDILLDPVLDGKTEATFSDLKESNQYFLRVRACDSNDRGNWSAPVTFTRKKNLTPSNPGVTPEPEEPGDDFPKVIEDLELITKPENGVTPTSFLFEFDSDLDEEKIQASDIIVTMRKV